MPKDPAILFYTSDFITGTFTMTNEQRGKYITLLCLQHQKGGYLTEKDMNNICSTDDNEVMDKFIRTGDGKYYNERMLGEIKKRKAYCLSRKQNRMASKKNENICETYVEHMENENEDINIDTLKNKEYTKFIELFNTTTGRKFKGTDKDRRQFNARIREGFTLKDFETAINNCRRDKFHVENPHFLTPEFITRADKLQKYASMVTKRGVAL